jgi:Cellulase (glycosyl hydrolase family 5)
MIAGTACNLPFGSENSPGGETPFASPPATFTPIATNGPTPTEHRIGVRRGPSGMEFYDKQTGERFVPRGANYHRWVDRNSPSQGTIQIDALFNTENGQLDMAEGELQQMAALGYNTIRVWKNACWGGVKGCIGDPAGGLSSAYLDNITKFLRMTKRHGIYVIFTDDWVPDDGGYSQELNRACCTTFDGYNMVYLTEHGIAAERQYWEDFLYGLIERGAPLDAVLAYELKNEAFYEAQLPPLNRGAGMVTSANGNTYDMADQKDRRRMMEDGWLYWIESLRNSILAIDPTALVTMGFFVQQEPHPVRAGDTRLVYLDRVVHESQLDFLDFHAYPGYDLSIQEHAENLAMIGVEDKLIIMGEFGAAKQNFQLPERAAAALQMWQVESCQFGFDGWLLWTWGKNPLAEFWNATDAGGLVGIVLSPRRRPNPCQYGNFDFIRYNAATQATITASSFVDGYPPALVADGTQKHWNAARAVPQWVEMALPVPVDIESILLTVAQDPPGRSVHEIWVRQAGGKLTLVHTFDSVTADGDVLTFRPERTLTDVDLVRIVTTRLQDLWPAWREIEILTVTPPQ